MKAQIYPVIVCMFLAAACNGEPTKTEISTETKVAPPSPADEPSRMAGGQILRIAPLMANDGTKIGTVNVSGGDAGGVRLTVDAASIPPGSHGMHFHQKADCSSPDFKSAGGHINPGKMEHGLKNPNGPDNADMENAVADENGIVKLTRVNPRVSMTGTAGLPALLDANGSALVIHINPDDQITQPIGGAGARIACAEIGGG